MSDGPIVRIGDRGAVVGVHDGHVHRFSSIPYAQPPINDLRFERPQPLGPYFRYESGHGPRNCQEWGHICPQPAYFSNGRPVSKPPDESVISEDCLVLNIWRPADTLVDSQLPVYAWIHGGWLQVGNPWHGNDETPTGMLDTEHGGLRAIVVTIGYRLNVFGFLSCSTLRGNLGLWDQRVALEWIQQNIEYFGGDPSRVTLGGLSAGSYSANAQLQHMLLANDRPLFQRVVMQSNAIISQPKSQLEAHGQFLELCDVCGISSDLTEQQALVELQRLPSDKLIEAVSKMKLHTFRPVLDDDFFPATYLDQFKDGTLARKFKQRNLYLMIGEVENEENSYKATNAPKHRQQLLLALNNYYSTNVSEALLQIPTHHDLDTPHGVAEYYGFLTAAAQVRAPIRGLVENLVANGVPLDHIHRYRIAMRLDHFDRTRSVVQGVGHGFDQAIWMYGHPFYGFSGIEHTASKKWLARFERFLKHEEIDWPTTRKDQYLLLSQDGSISVQDDQQWHEMIDIANKTAV